MPTLTFDLWPSNSSEILSQSIPSPNLGSDTHTGRQTHGTDFIPSTAAARGKYNPEALQKIWTKIYLGFSNFFYFRKKLSRMNMMIVHLSLADLFVAFCNVLPQLIWDITYRFYGGDFLCRFVKFVQVVAMYASSYVLVTTAIDR